MRYKRPSHNQGNKFNEQKQEERMKNVDIILLILGCIILFMIAIISVFIKATPIALSIIIGTLILLRAIREHDLKKE